MDTTDAVLLTPHGSQRIDRSTLATILPPAASTTFKPIAHADLVDALHAELQKRGLAVRQEHYAIQHGGSMLFGTLDLGYAGTPLHAPCIGLRTANDKSMALQIAVGLKVLVCDNLCFSGDLIALKRKHTAGLDLAGELSGAMDRYEERFPRLTAGVERLQNTWVSAREMKARVYDLFVARVLPARFFEAVVKGLTMIDIPRYGMNLWSIHNAFTAEIKALPPGPAFRATVKLGRILGLN